ncbi:MAG: hypothetical protein ACRDWA_07510 [Acidimicrobiia bacterium]
MESCRLDYWDESTGQVTDETLKTEYDLLLGLKTYEIFAADWPYVKDEPLADHFNKATKYVASNTLKDPTWSNTQVPSGDAPARVLEPSQRTSPKCRSTGAVERWCSHDHLSASRRRSDRLVRPRGADRGGKGTATRAEQRIAT